MSTERQTINIPPTKDQPFTGSDYFTDNRSKTALRELQQGDLLQLVRQICPSHCINLTYSQKIDHGKGDIHFADLNRQKAPDLPNSLNPRHR
jgi:hypothetical protein